MQGLRRQGRILALQLLYQAEIQKGFDAASTSAEHFWKSEKASRKARAFATELVEATLVHREEIDRELTVVMRDWKLTRVSVVIRNLLRMSWCEMMILGETPFPVVVNEAVDLARKFMDEESAKFVNSVLENCWNASPARRKEGVAEGEPS